MRRHDALEVNKFSIVVLAHHMTAIKTNDPISLHFVRFSNISNPLLKCGKSIKKMYIKRFFRERP